MSPTPLIVFGLLTAGLALAEEHAIETRPFEVVHQLDATVMPAGKIPLVSIEPKAWSSFPIIELAAHGSRVEKGEVLLACDARGIDKRIDQLKRQLAGHELAIAEAKDKLEELEQTAERRLEAARREAEQTREQLEHFTKVGRKTAREEALHNIKRNEQWLANEKEELRQLKQMYEADDLTEDTEEIILTRQQNAVEHAELMLKIARQRETREIEVMLPRRAVELEEAAQSAAVAFKYAERRIPRAIEQAREQLEALQVAEEQDRIHLADLEHDRQFFEVVADVDGIFYHGAIEDGEWTTGDLLRGLRGGGSAPDHVAFASLVPADAKLELVAHTKASKARQLQENMMGAATLAGITTSIPVKLADRSLIPSTDGSYQLTLSADWPMGVKPKVGNPATVHLLVYHEPEAIVIPAKALKFGAKGWSVELKLADGKTEARPVVRGMQSGDQVEILEGLEVGQVIITP
ncbi:MAG: hypothetical protein R3242_06035 [Akkermansiaceae bacterium]|nr:hypothetical protein [Akkermansiaceae bacterium]